MEEPINENQIAETPIESNINNEWVAPPPPDDFKTANEPPQMSEAATLGNIFFEPGRVFDDLRRKPRFIMASLILILATTAFNFLFIQKVGFEKIIRDRIESSPRSEQMSKEDKEKAIQMQSSPLVKGISYGIVPIAVIVVILLGGLIYWLGANAMGGSATFLRGVSVWVYSGLPPGIVGLLANTLVLFLKPVNEISMTAGQSGLIHANPSFFLNAKQMPVIASLLGNLDLFLIWGWVLAAIGLQRVAKISAGAAWAIVIILALIGAATKAVLALLF